MDISSMMEETGAVLKGHFQLPSGRHSDVYLEKFRLLEQPDIVKAIGRQMAKAVEGINVDVVLGAAVGCILISSATANAFGKKGIFAERVNGELTLRRGFELASGDRVLVVEDIVTTGGSVLELLNIVKSCGAQPAAVVCLTDRTADGIDFECPTKALVKFPAISWDPETCPLCEQNEPLTSRGRTGK